MFPEGIVTRKIEVGPALDLTSSVSYAIRVLVTASRSLVWESEPVLSGIKVFNVPAGEVGFIELPVTDQEGYRDSKGNIIELEPGQHSFFYKLNVYYLRNGSVVEQSGSMRVILPEGSGTVDIDDMVYFKSKSGGGSVYVPDMWSEQVAMAAASAAEAAASAAEVAEALENLEEFVEGSVQDWFDAHPESVVSPQTLEDALQTHKMEPTPHKAYDEDMPSLSVVFANGLI